MRRGRLGAGTNFTITGASAADVIVGGPGDDVIIGGGGYYLAELAGADVFKLTATSDSTPAAYDTIFDFQHGVDKIDLSGGVSGSAVNLVHQAGLTYVFFAPTSGVVAGEIVVHGDVEAADVRVGSGVTIVTSGGAVDIERDGAWSYLVYAPSAGSADGLLVVHGAVAPADLTAGAGAVVHVTQLSFDGAAHPAPTVDHTRVYLYRERARSRLGFSRPAACRSPPAPAGSTSRRRPAAWRERRRACRRGWWSGSRRPQA